MITSCWKDIVIHNWDCSSFPTVLLTYGTIFQMMWCLLRHWIPSKAELLTIIIGTITSFQWTLTHLCIDRQWSAKRSSRRPNLHGCFWWWWCLVRVHDSLPYVNIGTIQLLSSLSFKPRLTSCRLRIDLQDCSSHSLTICGDACPHSCVSAEACFTSWPNAQCLQYSLKLTFYFYFSLFNKLTMLKIFVICIY